MESLSTKPNASRWQQIGMQEYLLVAYPDAEVKEKVITEKKSFAGMYPQKIASKTQPNITVANFLARPEMEDTIIRYMQRICSRQASFNVELNNYSCLPAGTIYLRIQNPQPFKVLAEDLKVISNYVHSCSCPPVTLISNPHLAVARRVPDDMHLQVMMYYSQKTFHESFMVNELVLLRRSHQYDLCKTVQVFHLQPPEFKSFASAFHN